MTTRTIQLYAGPVSASGTALGMFPYAVPAGFRTILKRIHTFSGSTGERLIVSECNPAGTEMVRLIDQALPTATTDDFDLWVVMNQGEKLQVWVPGGAGLTYVNIAGTELELP